MASTERFVVEPIGVVRSPFATHAGTPVQPAAAGEGAAGTVVVDPRFEEGLAGIEGFERIWLLCWLDRTGPVRLTVVPYLDTRPRGLFATRAPSRPNPIGISPVRLLRRDGPLLHVADLDLLDGTPVLDIKPYADRFDVLPGGRAGWLDDPDSPRRHADERFEE